MDQVTEPMKTPVNPWRAYPLDDETRQEKFKAVLSMNAERQLMRQRALTTGWALGGVGVVTLLASAIVCASLFPLKRTTVEFYVADQSSGIISKPVSLIDAPRVFSQVNDLFYIRRYIEARVAYIPEMDQANDHLVKIMSSPAEQARVNAERAAPNYPARVLGKGGHITVQNWRFHRQPSGSNETRSYLVQFDLTIWRGPNPDKAMPYSATIDFQWHPELKMTPDDRTLNPGGFQCIAFSPSPDHPDDTRQ